MNYILEDILREQQNNNQIYKRNLKVGDTIFLKTNNSDYLLRVREGERFTITGGWFDKNNLSPFTTTIRGCSWGGSIINNNIVAACGLHLEFGNNVVTSRIKKIFHVSVVRDN